MQGHAAGGADRLVAPVVRQAHLVERMTGFVEHAHQALRKIVLGVARCDTHIPGHTAAERVQTDIQPPGIEIESEGAHQPFPETALFVGGERAFR